jgi:hypothetical protein
VQIAPYQEAASSQETASSQEAVSSPPEEIILHQDLSLVKEHILVVPTTTDPSNWG